MDSQTVSVKAARGLCAVVKGKASDLSQELAEVFEAVDGRLNFQGMLKNCLSILLPRCNMLLRP
ncbi:MAG: hypothetical protein PHV80_04065 [Rugosibacter sp.]|nr:hypothetical protein [Rugosibacter sp.]